MRFGTILADPPWPYEKTSRHEKLSGYSDGKYPSLSIGELADLPVAEASLPESVLLLWTTWPFLPQALFVANAWGFRYVTALPWVKADEVVPGAEPAFKPTYGVGYWIRGATEPTLEQARLSLR